MEATFKIKKDAAGKYRFNLIAPNGRVIASSEGYDNKAGCLNGIESVKKNAPIAIIKEET
jgi:uncharacterized protein YegP (UPF0339 family)